MVAIIDYNTGNCGSIRNMLRKIGSDCSITSNHREILGADRIILPGVGTFDHGMSNLRRLGLVGVLEEAVLVRRTPILGICLGMQLFSRCSEEGSCDGLGWISGKTICFRRELAESPTSLKIPHMGWNRVRGLRPHRLFDEQQPDPRFYFVHSYHFMCDREQDALTSTHHGYDFTSAVVSENIVGVQFHPEKSHKFGMQLFRSFIKDDLSAHITSDPVPAIEGHRVS